MPSHNRNIRSSSCTMPLLNRPAHSQATLGDRSFSFASSSVWISIPNDVRCAPTLSSSMSRLNTYLFRSAYKDWTVSLITVHMCMSWPCNKLVDGLFWKCINVYKKAKLINHDCLPILVLLMCLVLCIMLYAMLACLISNAFYLYNAFFFAIDFWKCFLFSCFILDCWHIACLFQVWFSIMRSAFNQLIFLILCPHHFVCEMATCSLEKKAHINKHYYYYYYVSNINEYSRNVILCIHIDMK